jgi:maltoporin
MARSLRFVFVLSAAIVSSAIAPTVRAAPPDSSDSESAEPSSKADDEATSALETDFSFGSYGRVQIDFDDQGNRGKATNVVSHGPRMLESSYAEVDFRTSLETSDGFTTRVLMTLALDAPFAHFSGDFTDQSLAVRNLYAETRGFPAIPELTLWVGSRMYRGDDVYLLDYWPLDELNTMGGGVGGRFGPVDLRAHVGVNRLSNDYQLQTIEADDPRFGTRTKRLLERQRTIGSMRAAYHASLADDLKGKVVAYGEVHSIPDGRRIPDNLLNNEAPVYPEDQAAEPLPSDSGAVLGAELGLYDFAPSSHVNLFVRWASGLAAYGEFGVPFDTAADGTASGARALVGALSANWETRRVGVMAGAYLRHFRDADDRTRDLDDFVEGAAVVRPIVFLTDHFHQAIELSYQQRHPFGLQPDTGRHAVSEVFQASILEIVSLGRGSYRRPQLRLHYTLSLSDEDARRRYPEGDRRRPERVEHFVGLGAEWWFNSSRY